MQDATFLNQIRAQFVELKAVQRILGGAEGRRTAPFSKTREISPPYELTGSCHVGPKQVICGMLFLLLWFGDMI